jgi:hypothetical protein
MSKVMLERLQYKGNLSTRDQLADIKQKATSLGCKVTLPFLFLHTSKIISEHGTSDSFNMQNATLYFGGVSV